MSTQTLEVPIRGMDCAECTQHVRHAIAGLPGVETVEVFLAAEKALVQLDPQRVGLPDIRQAVAAAGYSVADPSADSSSLHALREEGMQGGGDFTRQVLTLFGIVFFVVLFVVVVGEWLGLFEAVTERVPWFVGWALVAVAGFPVFHNVLRAALRRQVIAHSLMSVGVLAALAVGQWATAAVVVFFMRVGDYAEHFTTERARRAVRDLTALAPRTARVEREGAEQQVPAVEVRPGEVVIVRPGEQVPVDGEVIAGHATLDQAAITGEALPVEAGPGARVFAASLAHLGSLRVRATGVGPDSTFGRVIRLVEQAEANRAQVQRLADRFSAAYLPVVGAVALLTFLLRHDPLATAAVLVVACSCSFALATPIAMLASIGAGARRGLLIKGGRHLETLARADVLLIDKTGTLTLGKPQVTEVVAWRNPNSQTANPDAQGPIPHGPETTEAEGERLKEKDHLELLRLAASAERYSEHPLAEAVRMAAVARGLRLSEPDDFEALPGLGVRARVDGRAVAVGGRRLMPGGEMPEADGLQAQGRALLFVSVDGALAGVIAAADTPRPEVPEAIQALRALGLREIELLTGDHAHAAAEAAGRLGVRYRADLLPEDKIAVVRDYQARGHTVIMVGDGVNDAPALAQADVGIAMGAAAGGTGVALQAAHVALMRDDWRLVPDLIRIARRTMRVVKINLAFTVVYNAVGLTLAAVGLLPPMLAAAAQSLPDLGILANSSRLLRQK